MSGDDIRFRLLGPVDAVAGDRPLKLGGTRQRALLALLVVQVGRTVSADRLAEELWQGEPPPRADSTLRSYVSRLRSAVGPIKAGAGGYALVADPRQVDAREFEQLLKQGRQAMARAAAGQAAERFHAALALWRGAALADVSGGGALHLEAQRLDELRLVCVEERVDADLALGRHAELVSELERLTQEEPLRERFWRQLVLAYYRSERQADALAAYQRARAMLVGELGLEPGEELRELERAVLNQEVADVKPAEQTSNLPVQTTSFVGRDSELAELGKMLREHRLVTLTGVGGSGKTRLALEAAARQAGAWAAGVWLIDLTAIADPLLVANTVASRLGAREPTLESLVDHVRRHELLLVLDNCELLADACFELSTALLRDCPNVCMLATSRVPLGTVGEIEYAVDPLPEADAVELFLQRGRAVRRDFAKSEGSMAKLAEVCRDLDGIPLAIELAAAQAKALSLDDISERLADRFRFLRSWKRVADPRHQTLRATMDFSYELLSTEEQEFFTKLSVFAGGFTLDAAAAVCCDGDEDQAARLVRRLVDASLVRAEGD